MKRLYLNNNLISNFDPNNLAGDELEHLNLQNNNIVTFNPRNLNDNLKEIILGYNKIVNFNPTWFPSETILLSLENNPITTSGWNNNIQRCDAVYEDGNLYAGNNTTGSIEGTNTESVLTDLIGILS